MKKVLSLGLFFISVVQQELLLSAKSLEVLENKSTISTQLDGELCSCHPLIKLVVPTLLVGKMSYDLSCQLYYRQDIFDMYEKFENFIQINGINSLSDSRLYKFFSEQDIQNILTFEDWARNSYNSWLKPWNWTAVQKESYKKIELLVMVILYGPLFVTPATLNGENIIEHARKICCMISDYPLLHADKILDEHINLLSKNSIDDISDNMKHFILELEQNLLNIKLLLASDKEYLYEFYNFKTHTLLEQIRMNRTKKIH